MIAKGFAKPSDRIIKLKEMIMNAKPYVESERALLVTQSYQETEDLPMVLRRAKALEKLLQQLPVTIREGELIVGTMCKHPRSVQIYPEFSCEWVEQEFETMGQRSADPFIIPQETVRELKEAFTYWKGKTVSDLALSYMSNEARECVDQGIFAIGNYLYGGIGHINVDYGKIISIGCRGILEEVKQAEAKLNRMEPDYIRKQQFYKSVRIVYMAVIEYANRYVAKARELAEREYDSVRKAELLEIAKVCSKVPEYGASNFREACQSFWFIHMILQLESNGHSVSPGRFDQYMYPFYKMDTNLKNDEALELINCLWVKFNDINKIRDDRFAQAFAGYQAFQNLCVGGQTEEGFDASNELSYLCMETAAMVKMPSPSFSIRVWQGTPNEFLYRACEVVRLGLGVPAMYNDEVIIPALTNRGVNINDARNYCLIGCVEPSIPGKTEGWHDSAFFNVAKVLEIALNGGKIGDTQIGPVTKDMTEMKDLEDVLAAYKQQMIYFVKLLAEANNSTDYAHTERMPLPYLSALVDDCIGRGKSLQDGGAVYNFTGPQAVGLADAGDSVYAIQKNIFEDKKMTMAELKGALQSNFGEPGMTAGTGETSGTRETNSLVKQFGDIISQTSTYKQAAMSEAELYEMIKKVLIEQKEIDLSQFEPEVKTQECFYANGGGRNTDNRSIVGNSDSIQYRFGENDSSRYHSDSNEGGSCQTSGCTCGNNGNSIQCSGCPNCRNHSISNQTIRIDSKRCQEIKRIMEHTDSFGNDIDEVDLIVRTCGQIYCKEVEKYVNPRGGIFQAGMYPVSSNVLFGKDVKALPDGRKAYQPLADGVSPRAGKDTSGPTGAANSVAKLDHFIASNGTLYNQKFLPSAVAGDQGLKNFASVIRGYFDKRGMHVQFNIVDRQTLYAAQKEPEKYKDLIVRVAGYSAQFIVLNKEVQNDIINRTEHGF